MIGIILPDSIRELCISRHFYQIAYNGTKHYKPHSHTPMTPMEENKKTVDTLLRGIIPVPKPDPQPSLIQRRRLPTLHQLIPKDIYPTTSGFLAQTP